MAHRHNAESQGAADGKGGFQQGIYAAIVILSVLFALLCFPLALDVSLLSMPLSLAASFALWLLLRSSCTAPAGIKANRASEKSDKSFASSRKTLSALRKLLQYLPYILLASFILRRAGIKGTSYAYDAASVLLWCAVFVLSSYSAHKLSISAMNASDKTAGAKPRKAAWVLYQAVDWADALLQAVFMVLLIQIFIVQLYVIPSESMVPQFLIKDRVAVFKTLSGPKFPLSDVGIPRIRQYKKGDIVVFRNPHYSMDRKSEVRTVTSQLVYMLTFMAVNLNRDENGEPKADPLVKRVAGVPGEQLVMQDGVLYCRTKENPKWQAVKEDAAKAAWNLNDLDEKTKRAIETLVLSPDQYSTMIGCEKARRELDLDDTARECKDIAKQFEDMAKDLDASGNFEMSASEMNEYVLLSRYDSLTQHLLTSPGGAKWFSEFMTAWIENPLPNGIDIYSEANWRLNLMLKRCIGGIVLRSAQIIMHNLQMEFGADSILASLFQEADALHLYVQLLDQRNMCVLPPNAADGTAQYIPEDCYFMMGDNRFNSMDMRHSYTERLVPLTPFDKYSVTYRSNLAPQYVNASYILGTTAFRFWPPDRAGKL